MTSRVNQHRILLTSNNATKATHNEVRLYLARVKRYMDLNKSLKLRNTADAGRRAWRR